MSTTTSSPGRLVLDVPLGSPTRPTWRGRLHLVGLLVAIPLVVTVALLADGARSRAGVVVYGAGLCSMLLASTTYHRWVHTVHRRTRWRRIDHAMIFAAIAGTFTPLCLTLMGSRAAVVLLISVWLAAIIGATIKISGWRRREHTATAVYIGNGWAAVLLAPALWARGGAVATSLVFAGGVIYTVGAIGFQRRWPTLRPSTFSYHEVWHSCTLAAAGLHLAAVWIVTT